MLSNLYPLRGAKGGDPMSFLTRLLRRDTLVSSADLETVSDAVQQTPAGQQLRPQLPSIRQVLATVEQKYSATQDQQG